MHNYILHPSNMRNRDAELNLRIEEGAKGYGIYMMILELLRDATDYKIANNTKMIAFALNHNVVEDIERVINNYSLFEVSADGYISSPWLCESLAEMNAKREKLSEAGKRGARVRQARAKNDTIEEKQDADNQKSNFTPPARGFEGGLTPPHSQVEARLKGGSSILTNQSINKQINQPIKELLVCDSGKGWKVEDLKALIKDAKQEDVAKYSTYIEDFNGIERNKHIVSDLQKEFNLGPGDIIFLNLATNFGAVGGPCMVKLIRIVNKMRDEDFKPRFWGNYVLSKMLE